MEPKAVKDSDVIEAIECRVSNVESELLGMRRAAAQRQRDYNNQAIGFAVGVGYCALIYFILRR